MAAGVESVAQEGPALRDREEVLAALEAMDGLAPCPEVIWRLEKLTTSPDSSAQDVVAAVEQDPALGAAILRVANSAMYPSARKISSLRDAVVRLGMHEVRRIGMMSALFLSYQAVGPVDKRRFWGHSVAVALTCDVLHSMTKDMNTGVVHSEEMFLCGLLHDLGGLALSTLFPEVYAIILDDMMEGELSLSELEHCRLGMDHTEAGAILAQNWNMPELVAQMLRHHHSPWEASSEFRPAAQLLHVADYICHQQGFSWLDKLPPAFDHSAWERVGLQVEQIPEIIARVTSQGERSKGLLQALA